MVAVSEWNDVPVFIWAYIQGERGLDQALAWGNGYKAARNPPVQSSNVLSVADQATTFL
jgi:hypothetical protein